MSFKEKLANYYTQSYLKKYGDRITQVQGNVVSIKLEEKSILWIFNKITATILLRPERSRTIVKCIYKKSRWFKKPKFIAINQGNLLVIQGLKGKKGKDNREQIDIVNIRNLTTKKDLVPLEGKAAEIKKVQQRKIKYK
ncbi:hypothetical protein CLOACE_01360 [Clostridium acetireducens DSM 10703]|uniref:Uncharacterized protein n=1 Tax=Clostridium acetireducens DSM 10703 TaxID=1121290 RepID=A0A1E8F1X5_9CLOT|nr:hypothetical protein [Clostridium acetireducens]OFI07532.1 hypothetical protein CLOACE_01360 [Clostridium acetireducens DSM 10703]